MASKGIDSTLLHYGVRTSDMTLVEQMCSDYEVKVDWLKDEILKPYNEKKNEKEKDKEETGISEKAICKILSKALDHIDN